MDLKGEPRQSPTCPLTGGTLSSAGIETGPPPASAPAPAPWLGLRCPFSQPFPEADAAAGDQEGTLRERVALPLLRWAGPEAGLVRQDGTLAGSPLDQAAERRASSATC